MYSTNSNLRVVGILFLLATVASGVGFYLIQSVTNAPDYLATVSESSMALKFGVLANLLCDVAVIGIGILLFGTLKSYNETIAVGVLSTRLAEGVILMIGNIGVLLLLPIGKEYITAAEQYVGYYQTWGILLRKWSGVAFEFAMIVLGLGGFLLSYLLFNTRLVPRIISAIGLIGYTTLFIKSILGILGYKTGFTFFLPVAIFEFVFPIWIIAKGFRNSIYPRDRSVQY